MAKIEPGLILKDRYKIVSLLGQGGMGEVYLAEDLSLDTQVAIKINHNLNATVSNQFIREARLLASLKHPNLPRVIDYFSDAESQVLVMDYIPGDDLRKIVERKDKLSIEQITRWAVQLGSALSYLHNRKPPIFHRDVKPANIKVTPAGDVVLVDFGIAKMGEPTQETQTGAWAFSPGFAPPEQVSGMRTGPYTDEYSLASTLYYLFAGKAPVDSAKRLMGAAEYVPLEMIVPSIPAYINEAINRALSVKPEDRFENIADFIAAFTDYQLEEDTSQRQKTRASTRPPVSIPPDSPTRMAQRPPTPRKKRPVLTVLILLIILAVLGGGYFVMSQWGIVQNVMARFVSSPTATPTASATATEAILPATSVAVLATTEVPPTETVALTPSPEPVTTTETAVPETITNIGRGGVIAFVSNRQGDGYYQVWTMKVGQDASGNIVASDLTQLTSSAGDKSQPSWSPDGTKLIFTGESTGFAQNGTPYANDIWMFDLSQPDAEPVDLTNRAGDDQDASWSPTGDKIAFTSYYREDGLPQLFLMDANGSNQERISERFAEHFPVWTPNSDYLVYVMDYSGASILSMRDRWSLYKSTKKFDMSSDIGRLGNVSDPQVSLDGSMIVYTRVQSEKQNLYTAVFKDRGRTVTQLTDSNMDYGGCWSPDGEWIAFTSERDGNQDIYLMDANGQNLTNLTDMPAADKDPAWQPPQTSQ